MSQAETDKSHDSTRAGAEPILIRGQHRYIDDRFVADSDEYYAMLDIQYGDGSIKATQCLLREPSDVLRRDVMLGKLYDLFADSEPDDDVPDKVLDLFFGEETLEERRARDQTLTQPVTAEARSR